MKAPAVQRVLVTGGNGLLAHALQRLAPPGLELHFLGHAEFDLADPRQMAQQLATLQPQAVINTAAYNLVDRCEVERDLSWAINATAPEQLAALCAHAGIRLLHYGTDYIFDGARTHTGFSGGNLVFYPLTDFFKFPIIYIKWSGSIYIAVLIINNIPFFKGKERILKLFISARWTKLFMHQVTVMIHETA